MLDQERVARISSLMKISKESVKKYLEPRGLAMQTLEEAETAYWTLANNSSRVAALKRLHELLADQLEKTNELEKIQEIYHRAPVGSAIKSRAFLKWLDLAESFEEFRVVYCQYPISYEDEVELLTRWLEKASSFNQVKELYQLPRRDGKLEEELLSKLKYHISNFEQAIAILLLTKDGSPSSQTLHSMCVDLAKSKNELRTLHQVLYRGLPVDSLVKQENLSKIEKIITEEIDTATSIDGVLALYGETVNYPLSDQTIDKAATKLEQLCKEQLKNNPTLAKAQKVYISTRTDSTRELAKSIIELFCKEKLASSWNFKEVLEVYHAIPKDSPMVGEIISRLIDAAEDIEELLGIYKIIPCDSKQQLALLSKISGFVTSFSQAVAICNNVEYGKLRLKLYAIALRFANTPKEVSIIIREAPLFSELNDDARSVQAMLTNDIERMLDIICCLEKDSRARTVADRRLTQLCREKISAFNNIDDALVFFERLNDDDLKAETVSKIYELLGI